MPQVVGEKEQASSTKKPEVTRWFGNASSNSRRKSFPRCIRINRKSGDSSAGRDFPTGQDRLPKSSYFHLSRTHAGVSPEGLHAREQRNRYRRRSHCRPTGSIVGNPPPQCSWRDKVILETELICEMLLLLRTESFGEKQGPRSLVSGSPIWFHIRQFSRRNFPDFLRYFRGSVSFIITPNNSNLCPRPGNSGCVLDSSLWSKRLLLLNGIVPSGGTICEVESVGTICAVELVNPKTNKPASARIAKKISIH